MKIKVLDKEIVDINFSGLLTSSSVIEIKYKLIMLCPTKAVGQLKNCN